MHSTSFGIPSRSVSKPSPHRGAVAPSGCRLASPPPLPSSAEHTARANASIVPTSHERRIRIGNLLNKNRVDVRATVLCTIPRGPDQTLAVKGLARPFRLCFNRLSHMDRANLGRQPSGGLL